MVTVCFSIVYPSQDGGCAIQSNGFLNITTKSYVETVKKNKKNQQPPQNRKLSMSSCVLYLNHI